LSLSRTESELELQPFLPTGQSRALPVPAFLPGWLLTLKPPSAQIRVAAPRTDQGEQPQRISHQDRDTRKREAPRPAQPSEANQGEPLPGAPGRLGLPPPCRKEDRSHHVPARASWDSTCAAMFMSREGRAETGRQVGNKLPLGDFLGGLLPLSFGLSDGHHPIRHAERFQRQQGSRRECDSRFSILVLAIRRRSVVPRPGIPACFGESRIELGLRLKSTCRSPRPVSPLSSFSAPPSGSFGQLSNAKLDSLFLLWIPCRSID